MIAGVYIFCTETNKNASQPENDPFVFSDDNPDKYMHACITTNSDE